MPREISLSAGNANYFGHKDYAANRTKGFSNEEILSYLDLNPNTLRGYNVAGDSAGLYEKIAGRGQVSNRWGGEGFGHKDLQENRSRGWTDQEIKSYLDSNPDLLKGHNRPGGGTWPDGNQLGVYDSLSNSNRNWWTNLPDPYTVPEPMSVATPGPTMATPGPAELPGTQTGQANVGAGYNALGIRTPRPAGYDLNTGGTKKAFGRDKKNKDIAFMRSLAQLAINPLTL
tara:strand:- start:246 stop:932 length:687 start_codon:yes stop_codon:yes gene_type:complete